jgi:hypothetical protein
MAEAFDPYYTWLGIPPEEQPADYYRLLGVRRYESNSDVINNAADQRMAHIRTFQAGKRSAESQKLLNELAAAVVCLASPQKRAAYDEQLRAQEAARLPAPGYAAPPGMYSPMPPAWPAAPPLAQPMPVAAPVAAPSAPVASISVRSSGKASNGSGLLWIGLLGVLALVAVGAGIWAVTRKSKEPAPIARANPEPPTPPPAPIEAESPKHPETPRTPVPTSEPPGAETSPTPSESRETKTPASASSGDSSLVTAQGDLRTEWRYHTAARGTFKHTPSGWLFVRPSKPDEPWEEVARTPKYVELKEPTTGMRMRLQDDKFTRSTDGQRWVGSAAGAWVIAPGESTAQNANPPNQNPVETSKYTPDFAQRIPPTARPIEIISALDPSKLRISGLAERQGSNLHLAATQQQALVKFRLPVVPPPSYVLELEFTPTVAGTGTLAVGLVVAGKQCSFQIDSFPKSGSLSGLEVIGGKRVIELTEPLVVKGRVLKLHQRAHVAILVEPQRILAEIDGRRITTWEGDPAELSQAPEHAIPEGSLGLTLVRSDITLHSLKFTPLGGTPVANTQPTPAPSAGVASAAESPATPATAQRKPLPPEEELDAAKQRLKAAFGSDVAKAMKPSEKLALAKQLLEAAKGEQSDSVKYVVLQAARRLAIGGNDAGLALSLAADLASEFEIENVALVAETITDLAKADLPSAEQEKVVDAALKTAREALENEQGSAADSLSLVALTMANRAKDTARRKAAKGMRDEALRFKEVLGEYQAAKELLAVDENDAKSNLVVGKFLCFERQDWIRGREHLAKSGDEKLAAAAKLENAASSAREMLAAADAWFELRGSFSGREKHQVDRHAADLYELAAKDLSGLDKSKADNRLEELKTALAAADKAAAEAGAVHTNSKKSPIKYIEGIMVRAFASNQGADIPTPYVCNIKDYSQMPDDELRSLVSDNYRRSTILYGFGYLVLEQDTEVSIRIDACTCRVGTELLGALSGGQQRFQRNLKKGTYPVVLTFRSDSFERPFFALTDSKSGKNVLYFNEKEWLSEQAKAVPIPSGGVLKSQVIEPR